MQKILPNYPPATLLNPLKDAVGVSTVDYSAEFDGLCKRLSNVETLIEKKKSTWRVHKIPPWISKTAISSSTKGNTIRFVGSWIFFPDFFVSS